VLEIGHLMNKSPTTLLWFIEAENENFKDLSTAKSNVHQTQNSSMQSNQSTTPLSTTQTPKLKSNLKMPHLLNSATQADNKNKTKTPIIIRERIDANSIASPPAVTKTTQTIANLKQQTSSLSK
jgi:hypothetical protein